MKEYGVRRYGDALYHHCLAESPADAARWYAHAQPGMARKDFQALVRDVSSPGEPAIVPVKHGPLTDGARKATDLKRTSPQY